MAKGLLAGTATVSVNGTTHMLRADFKYKAGDKKRDTKNGMDGIHGYGEAYSAPYISMKLSDWGGLTVADFNSMTDATVVGQLANGKTIIGRDMWTVEEQEVDSMEGAFDVRFEGPQVTETTAS
jgi:hypothetical protein